MGGAKSRGEGDRRQWEIARDTVDTTLSDQIARGESLHAGAGILAGLAGVIVTLGGISSVLPHRALGQIGLIAAGVSAVFAVVVLVIGRPSRQPVDLADLVKDHILREDVSLTEDVLLTIDLGAVKRSARRLTWKARFTVGSAVALALAVSTLVAGSTGYGDPPSGATTATTTQHRGTEGRFSMAKNRDKQKTWDRVYSDVQKSIADDGKLPNPDDFQNQTTPPGSTK
jgi:hypothetical protein